MKTRPEEDGFLRCFFGVLFSVGGLGKVLVT